MSSPVGFAVAVGWYVGLVDVDGLLAAHDALWVERRQVLREWQAALRERERAAARQRRHAVARESALVRASGGLTRRQREWAERHGARPVSGAHKRAQRRVLVTWLYHERRIDNVAARWTTVLKADEATLAEAAWSLAQATARVLERWGKDAPVATGRTVRQLRSLAR
jgi:hypothetical protein